jgi:hypothetical protein
MAVVWYFIPLASMVAPFLVMAEVWKAGAPDREDEDWKHQSWPLSIVGWWISWILSGLLAGISVVVALGASLDNAFNPQIVPQSHLMKASHLLNVGGAVLGIVAAGCAILVIRSVMARQKEKYDRCFGQENSKW